MEKIIAQLFAQSEIEWDGQPSDIAVETETTVLPFFRELFGQKQVSLELPADFRLAMQLIGDRQLNFGGTYGTWVWDWDSVIENTKYWAENDYYAPDSKKEAWLCVGEYSDKHWYFICCNPDSPDYGQVVDGHDNTPWNDYGALWEEASNYTNFLKSLIEMKD